VEKQLMKTCLCFVEFVIVLIIRFVSNLKYSTYLKIGNVSIALNANNVELMSTIMKKILIKALIYQIMIINWAKILVYAMNADKMKIKSYAAVSVLKKPILKWISLIWHSGVEIVVFIVIQLVRE
jgi:hypothetical protein